MKNSSGELSQAISAEIARARNALRLHAQQTGPGGEADLAFDVHEARRAIKRARALLRLADPWPIDSGPDERLRDAGRALATLRDVDVLVMTAELVRDGQTGSEVIPASLLAVLNEEKEHRFSAPAADDGPLREADALLSAVEEELLEPTAAGSGASQDPAAPTVAERLLIGLGASYASARARSDPPAGVGPVDEGFHKLRKRVKDLRYQLEYLETTRPELGHLVRDLHRLTDLLGGANDLAMLETHAEATDALSESERAALITHLEATKRGLHGDAESLSARLFEEDEDAFVRRVEPWVYG